MKKLFKEVWKSFSKSKIILAGLTFLVFLTSGIITLLSDVVNTYTNQYEDYKKISQIHDLTMNSNIDPIGGVPQNEKGKQIYINENESNNYNLVNLENVWEKVSPISKTLNSIRVVNKDNLNANYIDLGTLNAFYKNKYVSIKDLSYILNANLENINLPNPNQSSTQFKPNKNTVLTLVEPKKDNLNNFQIKKTSVDSIENIYKILPPFFWWKDYTKSKVSNLNSLITNNDFPSLILDANKNAFIEDDDFLDPNLDNIDESKQYLTNPNNFYKIDKEIVARWFGFWKNNKNHYEFKNYNNINKIIEGNLNNVKNINDFKKLDLKIKFPLSINSNNTINNSIVIPKTITLDPKKPLNIPSSWFVYSQEKYTYFHTKFKLNNDLSQWSGIYKQYLEKIEKENSDFWKKIQKTSFWTKELVNKLVDINGNEIYSSQPLRLALTKQDLLEEITNKKENSKKSTILDIYNKENDESINPDFIPNNLPNLLNNDQHVQLENEIEFNSRQYAYNQIYKQINNIVENIGIRQTLTVNSNENKETQIYQFINIGNSQQEIDWNGIKIKQKVGNLIKSVDESQIYSLKSNVNNLSQQVPQNEIPLILDKLLTGLSLNRDYINPMISFQTFTYNNESNLVQTQKNAKIIWLTPNGTTHRSQLIGLSTIRDTTNGKKKYFILKEKNLNKCDWYAIKEFDWGDYEGMKKYILDHNLNFAPFDINNNKLTIVSQKGWLNKNNTYSDKFSVPFQYLLPSPEIIEQFNKDGTLELYSKRLILYLTQNVKPIINASNWEILMNAVSTGFSSSGFGEGLTPPAALSNQTIVKIIIYTLRDAIISTNQNFVNSFITDIFKGIQRQMNEYAKNDKTKQKEYLKKEIDKLAFIFNITMGLDINKLSYSIIDAIKNVNTLFQDINKIINGFDFDQIILNLYDLVTSSNRPKNQILTSADYLPIIYLNMRDFNSIFKSIKSILKNIDLTKIETNNDAINNLLNTLSGVINLIDLINIKAEAPGVGYAKLIDNIKLHENKDLNILYTTIGDNSLKNFLNCFKIKPIIGPELPIGNLIPENVLPDIDIQYDPAFLNPLELDIDLLWFLKNYVLTETEGEIFGVNTMNVLNDATNGFTQIRNDDNQITFEENASKIALVNEAFLKENKKEIYKSDTLEDDLNDLSSIDDKYKISISNVEYVITGKNLTVDYMYPVINAENVQVNTRNQALVYVNQYGYDRIKRSNVNSPTDKYFLLANPINMSNEEAQTKLNEMVYYWSTGGGISPSQEFINSDSNIYKKAYLSTESSLQNPERSLRITTINKMISTLKDVQKIIGIMLAIITAIVISFVVRRYISSRAKVIGILKAQGYTSLQIALSICLFPLIVSLIGGTLGYIGGHFAQLGIFNLLSIFWTMPIATAAFNWLTLVLAIVVPFIFLSILTILVTLWFLRKSSITLMNGSLEVNDSKSANWLKQKINKTTVKNKFSVSLALSSIGKLVALFIATLITSSITLFSVTSFNIFNTSVEKTYKNKNYTYQTDLTTPSIEGGEYSNLDLNKNNVTNYNNAQDIDKMLYVPLGVVEEGYTFVNNYFKPGFNSIINQKLSIIDNTGQEALVWANGNWENDENNTTTPHIFTKSSIDLTVLAGGLKINVWENLYNSIPESQRASIIQTSQNAATWLQWTQEGKEIKYSDGKTYITKFINFDQDELKEYLTLVDLNTKQTLKKYNQSSNKMEDVRLPYFKYLKNLVNPEKSHFIFRTPLDDFTKFNDSILILDGVVKNNTIRQHYRNFLVNGYNEMFNWNQTSNFNLLPQDLQSPNPEYVLDYFIITGANMLSKSSELSNSDETYTYVDAKIVNKQQNIKINGYNPSSSLIKIENSHGTNLLFKINDYKIEDNVFPIVINEVVKQKYNLNIGNEIEIIIQNHFLRNQDILKSKINNDTLPRKLKLKIIDICDTYINEEWITTQKIANEIIGISSYNGILTNNSTPIQIANSLSLYAPNGYWSAQESINNINPIYWSKSDTEQNLSIYKQLFYLPSKQNNQLNSDMNDFKNNSLMAQNIRLLYPNITNKQINLIIRKILHLKDNESLNLEEKDKDKIHDALNKFIDIYTNKSLQASLIDATSNGIEKEFALNASSTINEGMLIITVISFSISLVILIMISVMIINENERNIAIFGILGYSTKEKVRMFFSIYIPIVVLSLLLSILLVWLFIPIFSSAVLSTSSIALPIGLSWIKILLGSLFVITIFSVTCIIAWLLQGRIKPITLLKEV